MLPLVIRISAARPASPRRGRPRPVGAVLDRPGSGRYLSSLCPLTP